MAIPKKIREQVHAKYDGHCAYCGEKIQYKDMQVDHIKPKRRGVGNLKLQGKDDITNYNPACRRCNNFKHDFGLEDFRDMLEDQIRQLNERSSNYRHAKRYGLVKETGIKVVFYFEKVECDCKLPSVDDNCISKKEFLCKDCESFTLTKKQEKFIMDGRCNKKEPFPMRSSKQWICKCFKLKFGE